MIHVYKIIKRKSPSMRYKELKLNAVIISIKDTSHAVGFIPYVNFEDSY